MPDTNVGTEAPAPYSFFGWLDYDDADAERMREVLSAFDCACDRARFGRSKNGLKKQIETWERGGPSA